MEKKKIKLSSRVNVMSFMMIWLNVGWGHSHLAVLKSAQTVEGRIAAVIGPFSFISLLSLVSFKLTKCGIGF